MSAVMQNTQAPRKRCAVYTRKSSDEGLDQEFNSIDAQWEAGQAYIASQRTEGWISVADDYDDPAYSGGTMERPALKRLLVDIEKEKIDIVVVYKIDWLTRSLADFARMVEIFDRCGVSFSSVTQQINSATSMGRLMLNVLLSFAQFEREVTGERIRDKIGASKRKGLWMGGRPPLGYDVVQRRLVVNEREAATVRHIFGEFARIQSVTGLVRSLSEGSVTTKAWTTQDGRANPGSPIDKKYLHSLLRNQIYLGELSYKGQWYPGQHEAVLDRTLWEWVLAILDIDAHQRSAATQARGRTDALLRGLLFDVSGTKMHPTFTRKKGREYRYYISKAEMRFGAAARTCERIPAEAVESATVAQIKTVLSSPEAIAAVCREFQGRPIGEDVAVLALTRLGELGPPVPDRAAPTGEPDDRTNRPGRGRAQDHLAGTGVEGTARRIQAKHHRCRAARVGGNGMNGKSETFVSLQLNRVKGQLVDAERTVHEPVILRAIGRAMHWQALLDTGVVAHNGEIAELEGLERSTEARLLPLALLRPDIVEQCLAGRQPRTLTLRWLQRHRLPFDWQAQRQAIDQLE